MPENRLKNFLKIFNKFVKRSYREAVRSYVENKNSFIRRYV